MDYKEELKQRLDILPDDLRDFVLDENWKKSVKNISEEFGLNEEEHASLEDEVLFVLIALEPKSDFKNNIKNELQLDENTANWITEDVDSYIFSSIAKILNEIEKQGRENDKESIPTNQTKNNPNSYEQILINQAKAMRPVGVAPSNLPTTESRSLNPEASKDSGVEERAIHHSIGYTGSDPYREPAE